jgi:hypothetical protein
VGDLRILRAIEAGLNHSEAWQHAARCAPYQAGYRFAGGEIDEYFALIEKGCKFLMITNTQLPMSGELLTLFLLTLVFAHVMIKSVRLALAIVEC